MSVVVINKPITFARDIDLHTHAKVGRIQR